MTKREEAIEAMAEAIALKELTRLGHSVKAARRLMASVGGPSLMHRRQATAAFDAAVKVLSEPSEGMLRAGAQAAEVGWGGAEDCLQAMLKAAAL